MKKWLRLKWYRENVSQYIGVWSFHCTCWHGKSEILDNYSDAIQPSDSRVLFPKALSYFMVYFYTLLRNRLPRCLCNFKNHIYISVSTSDPRERDILHPSVLVALQMMLLLGLLPGLLTLFIFYTNSSLDTYWYPITKEPSICRLKYSILFGDWSGIHSICR